MGTKEGEKVRDVVESDRVLFYGDEVGRCVDDYGVCRI